jgi:hypothetical protein
MLRIDIPISARPLSAFLVLVRVIPGLRVKESTRGRYLQTT